LEGDENSSDSVLGTLQKGSIDVSGAIVDLALLPGEFNGLKLF
jgi:hypothetical protein